MSRLIRIFEATSPLPRAWLSLLCKVQTAVSNLEWESRSEECSYHQNLTESRRVDTDASQSGSTQSTSVQWPLYCVLRTIHTSLPPLPSSTIKQHICMLRPAQYIWGIKLENISCNNIFSSGVASLNTLHSTQVQDVCYKICYKWKLMTKTQDWFLTPHW